MVMNDPNDYTTIPGVNQPLDPTPPPTPAPMPAQPRPSIPSGMPASAPSASAPLGTPPDMFPGALPNALSSAMPPGTYPFATPPNLPPGAYTTGILPPAAANVAPAAQRDRTGITPRKLFFATMLIAPFALVGYGLYLYYLSHLCTWGSLCNTDAIPGPVQAAGILLLGGLLWLLLNRLGRLDNLPYRKPASGNTFAYWLRDLTDVQPVRWLLVGFGALALLGMLWGLLIGQMTWPTLGLCCLLTLVGARALFWNPDD